MDLQKLEEALKDLNDIAGISLTALSRDKAVRNTDGGAYLVTGGDSFNYNQVLKEVLAFIQEKDSILFKTIQEMLPEIKEKYRIKRNKEYRTIKQNYHNEKIATYKYKDVHDEDIGET